MSAAQDLRGLLEEPRLHLVPGVTSAFLARRAEVAGFRAVFLTGGGLANTLLAEPDIGLTTLTEVVEAARYIVGAVDVPVIADADTGYGNHLNVRRTVAELERAGVAGLVLEDQVFPKRCGHFAGKAVIDAQEMVEKLVSAADARRDPELVLIARTDAIETEGLSSALDRAARYVAAGADVVYVEAPRTREEMAAIPAAFDVPCLIDMVEGGLTPLLPADDLERMGYRLALYANLVFRASAKAADRALQTLARDGSSAALLDELYGWEERQSAVGLPEWDRLDEEIVARAARLDRRETGG